MRSPYVILARNVVALDILGGKCAECGSEESLEFDHIADDRDSTKRRAISNMLREAKWHDILTELEKCQLLCKKCHITKTVRTFKTQKNWSFGHIEHGKYHSYRKHGCRCNLCVSAYRTHHREYMREYNRKKAISVKRGVQV